MANNNSLNNTSYGFTLPSLNLNFTSTAQRITGDMSNATHANRLSFQTNVVNGATSPFIIPNGSGTIGQIVVANASNPTNSAFGSLQVDALSVKLVSNVLGLGVQLPIEIRIGTTAAINIDTARAVSIANTVVGNVPLTITGTTSGGLTVSQTNSGAPNINMLQSSATTEPAYINTFKSRSGGNINAADGLGNIRFFGFATANQVAAQITCNAESIGATRVSGTIAVWTTNTAGSTGQRLVLVADGGLSINTPSTAISALTVNGFATAGTYAQQNNAYVTSGLFSAFRALNVDGTAGGSCQIEVSVFNQLAATGGDATLLFGNYGGTNIKIGNDVSVNQFSMSTGNLGDANTFFTYDVATTQINLPRQCSFMARKSATSLNATGNNSITIVFDAESFDVSNSYNNATGIFTAPKTGKYFFYATVRIEALTALMTLGQIQIAATGQSIFSNLINIGICRTITPSDINTMQVSGIISMTTGDTAQVQVTVLNGAGNTASIYGGPTSGISTYFSGQLLS